MAAQQIITDGTDIAVGGRRVDLAGASFRAVNRHRITE